MTRQQTYPEACKRQLCRVRHQKDGLDVQRNNIWPHPWKSWLDSPDILPHLVDKSVQLVSGVAKKKGVPIFHPKICHTLSGENSLLLHTASRFGQVCEFSLRWNKARLWPSMKRKIVWYIKEIVLLYLLQLWCHPIQAYSLLYIHTCMQYKTRQHNRTQSTQHSTIQYNALHYIT